MITPSKEILALLAVFATAMTAPAYRKATQLLIGTILAPGKRTVSAALTVLGKSKDDKFGKYHRELNRDCWSPWILSKLLLQLLIDTFLEPTAPVVLLIDETLERRGSRKIDYVGCFRDAARSSLSHRVTSFGIRWVVLVILVPVPWSGRSWALPFMVIPTRSAKSAAKRNRTHRTAPVWAEYMITKVRRWQKAGCFDLEPAPGRSLV